MRFPVKKKILMGVGLDHKFFNNANIVNKKPMTETGLQ